MARTPPDPALVARARAMRDDGMSDRAVGAGLGVDHRTVARWLGSSGRGHGVRQADADAAEVTRLRDEEHLSWREVGARAGVSHTRARELYAEARDSAPRVDGMETSGA